MPSQFELYRVRGNELNDEFFNLRFRNIDARITALETSFFDLDSIADSLVSKGLAQITVQLNDAVSEIEESLQQVQTLAAQIDSSIQDLEDEIDDILQSGSLPAGNISVDSIPNLVATDAQAAFAELQSDIDGILSDISTLETGIDNLADSVNTKAPLASPNFSGSPTAPTPSPSDSSTKIATTSYVKNIFQGTVQTSRQVLGGGLVSGGGDLNQDRTLTVTEASQAEAQGGADGTKAMTPRRTKDYIDGRVASQIDAETGADNAKLMTPLRVAQAIAASSGGGGGVPIGTVVNYAGSQAPEGWLFCFGQNVSRTTYAALFSEIGTTYGNGDGSTTFTLPDCRGRTIAGKDNMGGSSANRLTSTLNGDLLGETGGGESGSINVSIAIPNNQLFSQKAVTTSSGGFDMTAQTHSPSSGSDSANYTRVQPTIIFNTIIFAGA